MGRPTFDQFRKKALREPDVKAAYDAIAPVCKMKRLMMKLRQAAGLTQEREGRKAVHGKLTLRPKVTRMTSTR